MTLDPSSTDFLYNLLNTPSPTGFEVRGHRLGRSFAVTVKIK